MKPQLGVLGSGRGSNLEAILEKINTGELDAEVGLVISDVEDSGIMKLAKVNGFATKWIDPGSEKGGRLSDGAIKEITDSLRFAGINLVVLAGLVLKGLSSAGSPAVPA